MIADADLVGVLLARIDRWRQPGLYTIGICGAQGSGKTTLVAALAEQLALRGVRVATLSLDDLYLTRTERQALALKIHPLFATRGVPGTHDIALGLATLDALKRGEAAPLPRFDKATDDRAPARAWPLAPANTQILLFEGWCVGATPQDDAALLEPVNALERDEDPHGIWRRASNAALMDPYQDLFRRINRLILLAAPSWEAVAVWREQQEADLRAKGGSGVMTPVEVARFIQHYERLTQHVLAAMPGYADLTVQLAKDRSILATG